MLRIQTQNCALNVLARLFEKGILLHEHYLRTSSIVEDNIYPTIDLSISVQFTYNLEIFPNIVLILRAGVAQSV
jgi:hypothetical protein